MITFSNDRKKSEIKSKKRRQGRALKMEELEGREMLDGALGSIFANAAVLPDHDGDHNNIIIVAPPEFQSITSTSQGPQASSASLVQNVSVEVTNRGTPQNASHGWNATTNDPAKLTVSWDSVAGATGYVVMYLAMPSDNPPSELTWERLYDEWRSEYTTDEWQAANRPDMWQKFRGAKLIVEGGDKTSVDITHQRYEGTNQAAVSNNGAGPPVYKWLEDRETVYAWVMAITPETPITSPWNGGGNGTWADNEDTLNRPIARPADTPFVINETTGKGNINFEWDTFEPPTGTSLTGYEYRWRTADNAGYEYRSILHITAAYGNWSAWQTGTNALPPTATGVTLENVDCLHGRIFILEVRAIGSGNFVSDVTTAHVQVGIGVTNLRATENADHSVALNWTPLPKSLYPITTTADDNRETNVPGTQPDNPARAALRIGIEDETGHITWTTWNWSNNNTWAGHERLDLEHWSGGNVSTLHPSLPNAQGTGFGPPNPDWPGFGINWGDSPISEAERNSVQITGLAAGTTYHFEIRQEFGGSSAEWYQNVETKLDYVGDVSAPTNLTATQQKDANGNFIKERVDITWKNGTPPPGQTITGYQYQIVASSTGKTFGGWQTLTGVAGGAETATITLPANLPQSATSIGHGYQITLRAVMGSTHADSNTAIFAHVVTPANVVAEATAPNTIKVTWDAIPLQYSPEVGGTSGIVIEGIEGRRLELAHYTMQIGKRNESTGEIEWSDLFRTPWSGPTNSQRQPITTNAGRCPGDNASGPRMPVSASMTAEGGFLTGWAMGGSGDNLTGQVLWGDKVGNPSSWSNNTLENNRAYESVIVSGLPDGEYFFMVRAEYEGGTSGWMEASAHAASNPDVPTVTGAAQARDADNNLIPDTFNVSWTNPTTSANIVRYEYHLSSNYVGEGATDPIAERGWLPIEGISAPATSATINAPGLPFSPTAGHSYTVQIRAVLADNTHVDSETGATFTNVLAPGNVKAEKQEDGTVKVTWDALTLEQAPNGNNTVGGTPGKATLEHYIMQIGRVVGTTTEWTAVYAAPWSGDTEDPGFNAAGTYRPPSFVTRGTSPTTPAPYTVGWSLPGQTGEPGSDTPAVGIQWTDKVGNPASHSNSDDQNSRAYEGVIITGLDFDSGAEYIFVIRAMYNQGTSDLGQATIEKVDERIPVADPGGVGGTVNERAVTVNWTPSNPPDGVTSYRVQLLQNGQPVQGFTETVQGAASATHTFNNVPNGTYTVTVTALADPASTTHKDSDTVAGAQPVVVNVATDPIPLVMTNVTANDAAATPNSVTLAWPAVTHSTTYNVQYRVGATGDFTPLPAGGITFTLTSTGAVINGLQPSTTYNFQVQAVGDGTQYTNSEWSNTASATTTAPLADNVLPAPQVFEHAKSENSITIRWNEVATGDGDLPTHYLVSWGTGAANSISLDVTGVPGTMPERMTYDTGTYTYQIIGLTPGTTYSVTAQATSTEASVIDSAVSAPVSITTTEVIADNVLPTPQVTEQGKSQNSITIRWAEVQTGDGDAAQGYTVNWHGTGGPAFVNLDVTGTLPEGLTYVAGTGGAPGLYTYVISGLTPNTTYTITVTATHTSADVIDSAPSTPRTITTDGTQTVEHIGHLVIDVMQSEPDKLTVTWNIPVVPVGMSVADIKEYRIVVTSPAGAPLPVEIVPNALVWNPVKRITEWTTSKGITIENPLAGQYSVTVTAVTEKAGFGNSPTAAETVTVEAMTRTPATGKLQVAAVNNDPGRTASSVVLNLNRGTGNNKAQAVHYYEIICTSHPSLGTQIVHATGGAQPHQVTGLNANTSYRFNVVAYGTDGEALNEKGTNVSAKTAAASQVLKDLHRNLRIKAVSGINSVELTGLTNGTLYKVDVWQTNGRAANHNSVTPGMLQRGEVRGYYMTVEFVAVGTTQLIEGLNRNSQGTTPDRQGLRYQFRISAGQTTGDITNWSQVRNVNGATVNFNARGHFPAPKGAQVSYGMTMDSLRETKLRFIPSTVPEVTHYEFGVRQGNDSVGFTGPHLEAVQAAVANITGLEVVNGKIRATQSYIDSLNKVGQRVELQLFLPAGGFQMTLAIRAVIVEGTATVPAHESANLNRAVKV